ncbi:MAG TPA: glutamine synthetase family protein [Flavihumibacter sp.]|jgi:glutamine synthetase
MTKQLTIEELLKQLESRNATKVKLAVTDIDGILRGKLISFEKFKSVVKSGFGFCNVVFGWDSGDIAYDNVQYTGWHTGYPDAHACIDISTFRKVPWENELPFFLADFTNEKGESLEVCPRSLLRKIAAQANEMGFHPSFSQEFEWFNFKRPEKITDFQSLEPITPGMFGYSVLRASQQSAFYHDLFDLLTAFDVPIEGIHTETGPGVYEAAILYSPILEAADRAVLFKSGVKEIAHRHGYLATFMAKVNENLPGCSGHVHQSLWDLEQKKNLFYQEDAANNMSELMQQYMAGQLYCLPHILPMLAPTINSYKRLVEGAWAPTTLTWAVDNRTTALRALPGSPYSTRLETRVVGSDSNPYLALAACLAAGLYGIKNKLKLEVPETIGNGYANKSNGTLPAGLWAATQAMKNSPIAEELFGREFTRHFVASREWECREFAKVVTNWETQRYLEII